MATLRDLGLSDYEERAYRSLLDAGPTTAKELSATSDVPMGRIYDVLNSLDQQSLVRSQTASRPKKYAPVEPQTALDRLLDAKKSELAAQREQYESIVGELQGELETTDTPDETFWTAAVGTEETAELLVERLGSASEEIVMCLSSQTPQLFDIDRYGETVLDELVAALDRGATVRLLLRRNLVPALPEAIGVRYRESLSDHDRFQVRTSDDITGTFTFVDAVETVVEVPHPLDRSATFGVIDLTDREFAGSLADTFEPRWTEADPLSI
ncbi:TrmB family transcriptional regulator [Halosegnis rubeus]|jgi:sugar-specific transcriptional regulator TrmB|uniref:TrmB family transcriptional regulator n=1 Tax=Halosegnis rubeus TaxID=2212850 RepID=A0A5N5UB40_9EURY|nr:helix-turn-helix domain-containing protein [Halosegnis rubeus]KAB7515768.1 TrmB family transcriptional regulator [Halosegnis rubeus]KAB7517017.1 TrmB family transcriptional regulator [Halosegnis rubeus]